MFVKYFTIPNKKNLDLRKKLDPSCICNNIKIFGVDEFDITSSYNIAFFTINDDLESEKFRNRFYSLHYGDWKKKIIDLGKFNHGHSVADSNFALKEITKNLSGLGILMICVGGNSSLLNVVSESLSKNNSYLNIVSVDKILGIDDETNQINNSNYISHLIQSDSLKLNFFCNLGYLRHLNSFSKIELLRKIKFDMLSLGDLRFDFSEAEPVMRDSHILNFNLESLKSNTINFKLTSPNGLTAFEACNLSRYAGISSSMKIVCYNNVKSTIECNSVLSEMVWYYIEGCNNRFIEDFLKESDFNYYYVEVDGHNFKFYKNKISKRWWVEYIDQGIISIDKDIIPCSENDYKLSQNSIISERIIKRLKSKII